LRDGTTTRQISADFSNHRVAGLDKLRIVALILVTWQYSASVLVARLFGQEGDFGIRLDGGNIDSWLMEDRRPIECRPDRHIKFLFDSALTPASGNHPAAAEA
jgi:hypothetical protein